MSCTLSQLSVIRGDTLKPAPQINWMQDKTSHDAFRRIQTLLRQVEDRLEALLEDGGETPPKLLSAMKHALLGGGKRFRPLLFILTVPKGVYEEAALEIGCALEMVHTASLILDDLPCMDDADLRRDKPTTHKIFGQATAILAAISLLTRGMNILASLDGVPGDTRGKLVAVLSRAVGHTGLAAGQEVDLTQAAEMSMGVEQKNWLKTGIFFSAMAEMASILSDRCEEEAAGLSELAFHIGSAFQALDDLLDATAGPGSIGKDIGKDVGKSTMITDRGEVATRLTYLCHLQSANAALARCGVEEEPIALMLQSIHEMAFGKGVPL
ncbi:geranylgeranyl diphosphate synthase type II [Pseudorhizobium tarimense]|uniref:Geranylgeranyl diphosphate synthase type II n=1 Tax=Pseudorhizobium tarimense TaxID=1079109 RepID=A0ABV2HDZ4_9HYPH|nr:polyprenyl synthetase family protein [Pseudorhizobium tarimense]MCJ8521728.1 polyprenyl synthetase family protein [Pseudorhizobium tarimense]